MEAITNNENTPALRAYSKGDHMLLRLQQNLPSRPRQKFALPMLILLPQGFRSRRRHPPGCGRKRRRALLADPNWPNDTVLEGLARSY